MARRAHHASAIGNGIEFIIFAGIVSQAPGAIVGFVAVRRPGHRDRVRLLAIVSVAVIVYIQEGQRRIPIEYAAAFAVGVRTRVVRRFFRSGLTRPA